MLNWSKGRRDGKWARGSTSSEVAPAGINVLGIYEFNFIFQQCSSGANFSMMSFSLCCFGISEH